MVLRIVVISTCICLINFSVFRVKADIDIKTARKWFACKNISRALYYTKKAKRENPTETEYYIAHQELERIYFSLMSQVKNP